MISDLLWRLANVPLLAPGVRSHMMKTFDQLRRWCPFEYLTQLTPLLAFPGVRDNGPQASAKDFMELTTDARNDFLMELTTGRAESDKKDEARIGSFFEYTLVCLVKRSPPHSRSS